MEDDETTVAGRVLANVRRRVDENAIAEQLANVVQGKSVRRKYEVDKGGNLSLVSEVVVTRPEDQARGLLFLQRLPGFNFGLTEKGLKELSTTEAIKQFAPVVDADSSIIWEDDDDKRTTEEVEYDEDEDSSD